MAGGANKKRVAMGSKKEEEGSPRDVVADLTDDVLVDILSLLPIKSLCRCKLVSRRWRNVISHPEHRKKLPQTLAGFFHLSYDEHRFPKSARHFTNVSRAAHPFIDPSLSFLSEYKSIDIIDSCNGLLLCNCWKTTDSVTMDYVVCNPATEKWVTVPDSGWSSKVSEMTSFDRFLSNKVRIARLGFDPAVSSHFHVFEFIPDDIWGGDESDDEEADFDGRIQVVAVYSSKTGVWSLNEVEDELPIHHGEFAMPQHAKSVFFNGVLHITTYDFMVLAIDVEGKILRGLPVPISTEYDDDHCEDVFLSQGHLYLTASCVPVGSDGNKLSVWALEDYNSENWILKYNVDPLHLFGAYYSKFRDVYSVVSIHPEHDMIFIVCGESDTLMSCEMDHMRLRFISKLGRNCSTHISKLRFGLRYCLTPYIPFVPLFLESLADDEQ